MRNHTVVIGYGTKGKTAVAAMLGDEAARSDIVVVDTDQAALDHAVGRRPGHRARRRHQIRRAAAGRRPARVLDHRRHQPRRHRGAGHPDRPGGRPQAKIVASIREAENQHLLKQSGADSVVVSSETAGRLLGVATTTPSVVEMIEDLLTPTHGFAIAEREVEQSELGGSPRHLRDIVLGVVRDGHLLRVGAPEADAIEAGDRLLYVRNTGK